MSTFKSNPLVGNGKGRNEVRKWIKTCRGQANHKPLLIVMGAPGTGKTTILKALVAEEGYTPIAFQMALERGIQNVHDLFFVQRQPPAAVLLLHIDCLPDSELKKLMKILAENRPSNPILCTISHSDLNRSIRCLVDLSLCIKFWPLPIAEMRLLAPPETKEKVIQNAIRAANGDIRQFLILIKDLETESSDATEDKDLKVLGLRNHNAFRSVETLLYHSHSLSLQQRAALWEHVGLRNALNMVHYNNSYIEQCEQIADLDLLLNAHWEGEETNDPLCKLCCAILPSLNGPVAPIRFPPLQKPSPSLVSKWNQFRHDTHPSLRSAPIVSSANVDPDVRPH